MHVAGCFESACHEAASFLSAYSPLALDCLCIGLGLLFLWSTIVMLVGFCKPAKAHPRAQRRLRFAVLVCARNEEAVIRIPIKSVRMCRYPAELREVIVLADNCSDGTADVARAAGAPAYRILWPLMAKKPTAVALAASTVGFWVHPTLSLADMDRAASAFAAAIDPVASLPRSQWTIKKNPVPPGCHSRTYLTGSPE